jgi:hypothetical protein
MKRTQWSKRIMKCFADLRLCAALTCIVVVDALLFPTTKVHLFRTYLRPQA